MIYLSQLEILEDVEFDVSRDTHKKFNTRKFSEKVEQGYRDAGKVYKYHLFKLLPKDLIIEFNQPITALVGDNGCGKSTLLKYLKYKPYDPGFRWDDPTPEELQKEKEEDFNKYLKSKEKEITYSKFPRGILFLDGLQKGIIGANLQQKVQDDTHRGTLDINDAVSLFKIKRSNG